MGLFDLPPDMPLSIGDPPPCPECSAPLVRTSDRWMCCPQGHGGLVQCPALRPATAERNERHAVSLFGKTFTRYVEIERQQTQGNLDLTAPDRRKLCPHCNKPI